MKNRSTAHTIRTSILSFAAVAMMWLPLLASATTADAAPDRSLLSSEWAPEVHNDPEALYGKLKGQSREVCGPSDRHITGSVRRTVEVEACYEGTLTAAVERLDNPEVTELHQR